jgi:hypothetical protein
MGMSWRIFTAFTSAGQKKAVNVRDQKMSERKRLLPIDAKEWLKMVFWRVSEDGMVLKGAKRVELTQQVNRKLDCKGAMEL